MPTIAQRIASGGVKPRRLEALAFYLGAHGIDKEPVMAEIEARLAQDTSEAKEEPRRVLHALEARRETVKRERPETEAVWTRVRKELGDVPPPYFHAVLMAIFAVFAIALDTLFLAPTMDILNIAHPALQFLAASGVAAVSTGYFELTGTLYIEAKGNLPKRITAASVAALGVFALVVWGLLRGDQLRFAAGLAGNPLGDFLAAHPVLAAIFYIFITLVTPVIGAVTLLLGSREFSRARTWRRVKERFESLRKAEINLNRQVQAEEQRLKEFDRRKDAEAKEWKAIFHQFYARGQQNGACRETRWSVLRKSALGGLVASPLGLLIPVVWFPAQCAPLVLAALGFFVYFNHRRHHPSHERYLKQENTHFAVIPDARPAKTLPAPPPHLLTKGDSE
ncbi:MAG TPA: hypothetical protein VNJ52_14575 [Patescibacteria group bacterium]|nr:hypothetical protein [Patescibacteria group bacterium]